MRFNDYDLSGEIWIYNESETISLDKFKLLSLTWDDLIPSAYQSGTQANWVVNGPFAPTIASGYGYGISGGTITVTGIGTSSIRTPHSSYTPYNQLSIMDGPRFVGTIKVFQHHAEFEIEMFGYKSTVEISSIRRAPVEHMFFLIKEIQVRLNRYSDIFDKLSSGRVDEI